MSQERRPDVVSRSAAWPAPWIALPAERRSVTGLLAEGVLDAELAALLWLLIEARLPFVVVGPPGVGRARLLAALLDFLSGEARQVSISGAEEDFEWLPEAPELGWRRERTGSGSTATSSEPPLSAANTVLLVAGLGDGPPAGTGGPRARVAIRALAVGYGMAATMTGGGLDDVFATLRAAPVGAGPDELSRLGVVLVMNAVPMAGPEHAATRRRVVAAHYVRPVVRDAHGHVQRLAPAILAAYEPVGDRLEHFAWGIASELAGRTGRSPVAFEQEQAQRAGYLSGLVASGITGIDEVRGAIAGYRGVGGERPA